MKVIGCVGHKVENEFPLHFLLPRQLDNGWWKVFLLFIKNVHVCVCGPKKPFSSSLIPLYSFFFQKLFFCISCAFFFAFLRLLTTRLQEKFLTTKTERKSPFFYWCFLTYFLLCVVLDGNEIYAFKHFIVGGSKYIYFLGLLWLHLFSIDGICLFCTVLFIAENLERFLTLWWVIVLRLRKSVIKWDFFILYEKDRLWMWNKYKVWKILLKIVWWFRLFYGTVLYDDSHKSVELCEELEV